MPTSYCDEISATNPKGETEVVYSSQVRPEHKDDLKLSFPRSILGLGSMVTCVCEFCQRG